MPLPTLGGASIGGGSLGNPAGPRRPRPNVQGPQQPQQPGGAAQQTFKQLQDQGLARPAPAPAMAPQLTGSYTPDANQQQFNGQLQNAVSQRLQQPGRYDTDQVKQVRDALTGDLEQQFGAQRKGLEEDMARRGLSASTIGSGYYGDLAGQQSRAMAGLNAQLIQDAAGTNAQDMTAALAAGQSFGNALSNQGLAGYGANLQGMQANNASNMARQQYDQGQYENASNLALGAGSAAGSLGLGQQSQDLQRLLGMGGLGLQQQQLGESARQFNVGSQQQGQQFQQQLGEGSRQFDLQQQLSQLLGLGGLGVQQGQLDLSKLQNSQQFGMQGAQLGENQRQFNLQQQLNEKLGLGGLGAEQQRIALAQKEQQINADFEAQRITLADRNQQLAELSQGQQNRLNVAGLTGYYDSPTGSGSGSTLAAQQQALAERQQRVGEAQWSSHEGFSQDLARDQLTLAQRANAQDLVNSDAANRRSEAELTGLYRDAAGNYKGATTLGAQQFQQQLAQQLGLATMSDQTANRGIDANVAGNQSQFWQQLAGLLAQLGGSGQGITLPTAGGNNPQMPRNPYEGAGG